MNQLSWLAQNSMCGIIRQFVCFAGMGVIGTSVHYFALLMLVEIAGVKAVCASMFGFGVGALVNYSLNYHFTFQSNKPHQKTIVKFFTIAVMGLALNSLIMVLTIEVLSIHYLLAQMIATGHVLIWNFVGNRSWTFGEEVYATGHR